MNQQEQMEQDLQKSSLINDLNSVITVMEELYQYHPNNPNKRDLVSEYSNLERIKEEIENELDNLN